MPSTIQPSFSAGEITPSAHGRVDLARYQSGLKTCRNFITRVHGGVVNRPGTQFVAKVRDRTKKSRLISFVAASSDSYALEFSDLAMAVIRDGGLVLETNKAITGVTNTSQVVIASASHGYSEGDRVYISGTDLAAIDGRFWLINAVTPNTFQLVGSLAPGGTASTGTVARVFTLTTPYSEAQLTAIKYTQLNDVMTLAHGNIQTRDLSRFDHASWTLAAMPFENGPFQDVNVTKTKGVVASAVSGQVTIQSSHAIFSSVNVGQLFYLEQKDYGKPWEVTKVVAAGDIRRSEGKYYEAMNAGTTGTLRPSHEADTASDGTVTWLYKHNGWGVVLIDAVVDDNTMTGTVQSEIPIDLVKADKAITGAADNGSGLVRITSNAHGYANNDFVLVYDVLGTTEANGVWRISGVAANTFDLIGSAFVNAYISGGNATINGSYKWAFGAWGGDRGWPANVTYFQQRKTLAATPKEPLKSWYSATNSFPAHGKHSPIIDDDAFSMTLASNQADPIVHLVNLGKLVALTASVASSDVRPSTVGGGKWVIPSDDNNPVLTPSKRSARAQEGDSVLYVSAKSHAVKDLAYEFASNAYDGKDLSVLSKHLLEHHTIVDAAYQHVPFQIYWLVRDDGVMLGMTYLKEHEVWGWHRHDTTQGFFERVCVIPEGGEDRLYCIVRREINGQTERYIERLASRQFSNIKDAFFVDSGLTYDGRNTSVMTMTLSGGSGTGYGEGEFGENEYGYEIGSWPYAQDLTLTASGNHFKATDDDTEIHFTLIDGRVLRLRIIEYVNFSVVKVRANRDVPSEFHDVAVTAWGHARKSFIGLGHLEAATVSILADGHEHPQRVVVDEAIELQYCAVVVTIGLPIEGDLETLNLNIAAAGSILDKEKLMFAVRLMVEETRGLQAGQDAEHLMEFAERRDENYDDPVTASTGLMSVRVPARWEPGGRVFLRQSSPLPASVLAVMPDLDLGGSK